MKKIFTILLALILVSCNVLPIPAEQKNLSSSIELGTIGIVDYNMLQDQLRINAIPVLKQKIRLTAATIQFNKYTTKRFNNLQHEDTNKKVFIDSLESHENYIQLNIIDKVALIEEINAVHNKNIITYLKTVREPVLVSSITATFPESIQDKITNADALYLMNDRNSKYVLKIYNKGKLYEILEFSQANIFDYETMDFCWFENEKHQTVVSGITNKKCAKNTYKSYNKVIKKKKEFKF